MATRLPDTLSYTLSKAVVHLILKQKEAHFAIKATFPVAKTWTIRSWNTPQLSETREEGVLTPNHSRCFPCQSPESFAGTRAFRGSNAANNHMYLMVCMNSLVFRVPPRMSYSCLQPKTTEACPETRPSLVINTQLRLSGDSFSCRLPAQEVTQKHMKILSTISRASRN